MVEKIEISLRDGTLVRHKMMGYEGRIEGTTAIKTCFTRGGILLAAPVTKESYQYRVAVTGAPMRYIAPVDDLEILDAATSIICLACQKPFYSRPGLVGKACGRCACGGWICPSCLACQSEDAVKDKQKPCINQRKRFLKKIANDKKHLPQASAGR
jgi:hypothetical protein